MATYYVRKTGLDSNDGLSAGAAFLTIDKAANTVTAPSTVYVGAGVYRELVTMDTSGTSGNIISYIADVDGEQTGDAGLVIISAYANETSAATRASCWNPNGKEFITVRGFTMTGGTSGVVDDDGLAGNRAYEEVTFEDCVFISGSDDLDRNMDLDLQQGATPTTAGLTIRRCIFHGAGIRVASDENATAEVDCKMVVESCIFIGAPGGPTVTSSGFHWDIGSTSSFHVGGVEINNCSFFGHYEAVHVDAVTPGTPTNVVDARNNHFVHGYRAMDGDSTGILTSDYNTFASIAFPLSGVSAGGNDRSVNTDPGLIGGIGDYTLYRFLGWSPWKPWEPIRIDDGVAAYTHAVIGDANTTDAPAFDLYNENRPMWGTADDRGAVEGRAYPEQETTTTRTGSNAMRFEGAGYQEWDIPVKAQSTTVSVYGRYDATYSGTLPQLEVRNIDGTADQTDTMTGAANNWEELTATFTPDTDGWVQVRVVSNDTSAGGECFFDDLTVT